MQEIEHVAESSGVCSLANDGYDLSAEPPGWRGEKSNSIERKDKMRWEHKKTKWNCVEWETPCKKKNAKQTKICTEKLRQRKLGNQGGDRIWKSGTHTAWIVGLLGTDFDKKTHSIQ